MQGLCPPGYVAKFSKMSGVQPWQNAVVLFVNIEENEERRRALEVDETYYDKESEATEQPLLLFLRHTQGPYIYCGRLGYLGHRPASKPLEFRWQLLDVN
ncbi:hypothetical protein PC117_g28596, partial [Phytophthora cactorum]